MPTSKQKLYISPVFKPTTMLELAAAKDSLAVVFQQQGANIKDDRRFDISIPLAAEYTYWRPQLLNRLVEEETAWNAPSS